MDLRHLCRGAGRGCSGDIVERPTIINWRLTTTDELGLKFVYWAADRIISTNARYIVLRNAWRCFVCCFFSTRFYYKLKPCDPAWRNISLIICRERKENCILLVLFKSRIISIAMSFPNVNCHLIYLEKNSDMYQNESQVKQYKTMKSNRICKRYRKLMK